MLFRSRCRPFLILSEHGQYQKRPAAHDNEKSIGLLDSLDFPRKTPKNGDPALDFPLDSLDFPLDFAGAASDGDGVKVQESNQSPIKVQSENAPHGAENGESPIVQSKSNRPVFYKGQRVRVPAGEAEVLQAFEHRITVLVQGEVQARLYEPSEVAPLEAPF